MSSGISSKGLSKTMFSCLTFHLSPAMRFYTCMATLIKNITTVNCPPSRSVSVWFFYVDTAAANSTRAHHAGGEQLQGEDRNDWQQIPRKRQRPRALHPSVGCGQRRRGPTWLYSEAG